MKRQDVVTDLTAAQTADMRCRRMSIAFSLLGIAAMTPVVLLQMGLVKHLPDPPLPGFDSDKVNKSTMAFALRVPDGVISLFSLSLNILIAASGPAQRHERRPWLSRLAAAKGVAEGLVTVPYLLAMPLKEKAWCPYCLLGALANFAVGFWTLKESNLARQRDT